MDQVIKRRWVEALKSSHYELPATPIYDQLIREKKIALGWVSDYQPPATVTA